MGFINLNLPDLIVLIVYFGATLALGAWFSRKNTNTEEYFLGGRSFPGWALGLSLLGTSMSSVTFIAYPADGFKTTLVRLALVLMFPVAAAFGAYVVLPFFRRGTITSPYEYLARRYGRSISSYAAMIFLLLQVIRVSSILYLVSLIFQSVMGLPFLVCILIAGGVTALYTVGGGFDAVIWTDVLQTLTLVLGALLMVGIVAFLAPEGLSGLIQVAYEHGKFSFSKDLNPVTGQIEPLAYGFSLQNKTFLMLFIVGIVQFLNGQFEQTSIQRWCSAKSAKEARKAIAVVALSSLPVWAGFMMVGTMLWAYFYLHPNPIVTEMLNGTRKAEEIVPYFITHYVPAGLAGLIIAGALAAAMSSLSSSINAVGMVWVRDIYKPLFANSKSDRHYLLVGFIASAVVSLLMIAGAWLLYRAEVKTLNDLAIILANVCGGGMLAVFMFGVFTRRGNAKAIWVALVVNAFVVSWIIMGTRGLLPERFSLPIHIYYSSLVGNVLTFAIVWVASLVFKPAPKKDFTNLTFWDQDKTPLV
jgi:SSS family solute:Na+ symporter